MQNLYLYFSLDRGGNSVVTTEYFGAADPMHYKCDYGGEGTGLNKDISSQKFYNEASDVATQSTKAISMV